ncbi:MAG: helix-turn-helix transcriptional regulator [bacterium]|nr:helix-turn-helix transcriptional regulator [bacterium]
MTQSATALTIVDAGALGRALRERRRQDGLTLAEAAGLTNVGIRFLSELENGKPTVRLDKVMRVVAALGLQLQLVPAGGGEPTWTG